MSEELMDRAVAVLNEAVTLDPNLWSLFDCMVPCAPIVARATPIELMSVNKSVAMASVLGIINGLIDSPNCRISIVKENAHGSTRRVFARTSTVPVNAGAPVARLPEDPAQG